MEDQKGKCCASSELPCQSEGSTHLSETPKDETSPVDTKEEIPVIKPEAKPKPKEGAKLQQGHLHFSPVRVQMGTSPSRGHERLVSVPITKETTPPADTPSKETTPPSSVPSKESTPSSSEETTPLSPVPSKETTPLSPVPSKETTPLSPVPSKETTPPADGASKQVTHPCQEQVKPKLTKAERERLKAETKAKKEEERKKKEQEKQQREQERKEKQLKKEQELKERREKKEREELEKKERKEKREAEKKKKEEERKKKLEEKLRLEQEKEMLKEEKLRKENQAKLKFRGYFGKISKPTVKMNDVPSESILTPFSVKDGMSLAVAPHAPLQDTAQFDHLTQLQDRCYTSNYIEMCKSCPRKSGSRRTKNEEAASQGDDDDDVILVSPASDLPKQRLPKFKLLQFAENHRPAYYGTWRKTALINPRNPFRKDEGLLDYEVDSDMEWEEEEPGESISSSEGEEKDGDGDGEDSDEDDGFFVPHGYLSNDEGDCSDSGELIPGPDDNDNMSLADMKRKKQLAKAWEVEFARKCQPLEPKVIGCLWLQFPPPAPTLAAVEVQERRKGLSRDETFLMQFAVIPLAPIPILPTVSKGETTAEKSENQGSCNAAESTKQPVPDEAMPDLIRFIHKSHFGMTRIIKMFRAHWGAKMSPEKTSQSSPPDHTTPEPSKLDITPKGTKHPVQFQEYESLSGISKRQLEKKIQTIAVKESRPPVRCVWYVHGAVLKQYGLGEEDFIPLVQDVSGSPILTEKTPEQLTPPITNKPSILSPDSVNTAGKAVKRKTNGAGKSLFQFLSPVGKTLIPHPKRPKIMPPQATGDVKSSSPVIITTQSPQSQDITEPVAKKPRLAVPSPVEDIANNDILLDSTNSLASKNLRGLLLQEPIIIT